jgi:hypothetical protein
MGNLIKATPQSNQGYNAQSLKHKERTGKEPVSFLIHSNHHRFRFFGEPIQIKEPAISIPLKNQQ